VRNLFKKFFRNEFLKNSFLVGGGTLIAQGLAFLLMPLITRYYCPSDFGVLQNFQYIAIFFISISSLKFDIAILTSKNEYAYRRILATGIVSVVFITLLSVSFIVLMSSYQYFPLFLSNVKEYIGLLPLITGFSGFFVLFNSVIIFKKRFKKLGESKISQVAGVMSTQISLGFLSFGAVGLLLGEVVGKITALFPYFNLIIHEIKSTLNVISVREIKDTFFEYKKFPLITTPGSLINIAGYAIPILLFGNFYGTAALGFYSLVNRCFAAPSALIGQSISQVFSSDITRLYNEDPKQLLKLFVDITKKLSALSIVPVITIFIFAPSIFAFVFGSEWEEAGKYFRVLAPLQFFGFIVGPLTPTLNLIEKQNWQFAWEVARFITTLIFITFAYLESLEAITALGLYSFVMTIFYIFHILLSLWFIWTKIVRTT